MWLNRLRPIFVCNNKNETNKCIQRSEAAIQFTYLKVRQPSKYKVQEAPTRMILSMLWISCRKMLQIYQFWDIPLKFPVECFIQYSLLIPKYLWLGLVAIFLPPCLPLRKKDPSPSSTEYCELMDYQLELFLESSIWKWIRDTLKFLRNQLIGVLELGLL